MCGGVVTLYYLCSTTHIVSHRTEKQEVQDRSLRVLVSIPRSPQPSGVLTLFLGTDPSHVLPPHQVLAVGYPISILSLHCPGWIQNAIHTGSSSCCHPDRNPLKKGSPGKRNGWWLLVLGLWPDFPSTLGTKVHLGEEHTAWPPPALPHPEESCGSWTETQPEPERAVCCSSPLPSRQARRLPNPWNLRKRRPDRLGTCLLSQRGCADRRQAFHYVKHLAPSSSLCILLAILYPVWEFQKHLQLSFVQPHMCRLKSLIMLLPATLKSQKSLATTSAGRHLPPPAEPRPLTEAW